jgi:hypothetical protein
LVYAGKLGGWYLTEAMVSFFATARGAIPGLRWHVWTQSDPGSLRASLSARGLDPHVTLGSVPAAELPVRLAEATAALSLIKPCRSKVASSPTKVGEYLAAGLPVVSTSGIGDLDGLITDASGELGGALGVVLPDCSDASFSRSLPQLLSLMQDPNTSDRCRRAAVKLLDLVSVGWPRYRETYRRLLG